MKRIGCFLLLVVLCKADQRIVSSRECASTMDCGHGQCYSNGINETSCRCDRGWIDERTSESFCSYKQKSQLAAFLLSFFLGLFGADWFYLSAHNGAYLAGGIFKLLTAGGLGVWWLVDWMRILTNAFPDGQGQPLSPWNP